MDNCDFCAAKDENVILQNDSAVAFLSRFAFRKGHCVVVSRRHVKSVSELTEKESTDMSQLISKVAKVLEDELKAEKTYIISIGDMVEHFHYHLIPKLEGQTSLGVYCFGGLQRAEGKFVYEDGEYEEVLGRLDAVFGGGIGEET